MTSKITDSIAESQAVMVEPSWFKTIDNEVQLVGTYCRHCKKSFFPIKPVCPDCFEGELETIPLSKTGTLHTFALSVMGPADMDKPYVIGFIDLPEQIKLYTVIADCQPWDKVLKVGMKMKMTIGRIKKDDAGKDVIGYYFTPDQKEYQP